MKRSRVRKATIRNSLRSEPQAKRPSNVSSLICLVGSGAIWGQDGYARGAPTPFDRGVRDRDVVNYFDGGDPRQNPSTAPPQAGARWLSPAPDGLGRWVWGDSNYNTGMWVETANKRGFVTVAILGCGMA